MARIQFDYSGDYGFTTELQVYISPVNYGGHLDNALLLTLVSEARVRFFRALGHSEANVGGLPIVVGDMQAQYRSEAYHGETLRVEMMPLDLSRCAFDLVWRITEVAQGREVARGKSGIVFVNGATRRAATMPEAVRAQLQAL